MLTKEYVNQIMEILNRSEAFQALVNEKDGRQLDDYCMGKDITFHGPMIYEQVMGDLELRYAKSPNRGEFMQAMSEAISVEQAQLWFAFPRFTWDGTDGEAISLTRVTRMVPPEIAVQIEELAKDMEEKGFLVCRGIVGEEKVYMRNYLFGIVARYCFIQKGVMTQASLHWYYNMVHSYDFVPKLATPDPVMTVLPHEGVLTGNKKYGRIPMNIPIPDQRAVITFDKASEVVNRSRRCAVIPCICRKVSGALNVKECNHDDFTCMMFDNAADDTINAGLGVEKTKEEMLELLKKYRDDGLVQTASNANYPHAICNCCKDCCVFLNTLQRGEKNLCDKSRYVARAVGGCIQCGNCVKACPMETIKIRAGKLIIFTNNCIGCGVCASKCPKGAITLELVEPERTERRVERFSYNYC